MDSQSKQNNILSISNIVEHYDLQGLTGKIKIFFRKSDIKTHNSKLDKPYYIVKPLVVKVGPIFDDHPNFSFFLKPKYNYRLSLINVDMWVMIIDDEVSTFKNDSGENIDFYNVSLKYITNEKIISSICEKALSIHNVEEFDDEEI